MEICIQWTICSFLSFASPSHPSIGSPTSSSSTPPSTIIPTLQPSIDEPTPQPSAMTSNDPSTPAPAAKELINLDEPKATPLPTDAEVAFPTPTPALSNSPSADKRSLPLQSASVSAAMTMTTYLPTDKLDGKALDVWKLMTALHILKSTLLLAVRNFRVYCSIFPSRRS